MKQIVLFLSLAISIPALAELPEADAEACRNGYYQQLPEGFKICYPLAEKGDPEAQKILADMYYWGWGDAVAKDYNEAVLWYKRAAKNGNVEAKYNLGVLYEQGKGLDTDYKLAVRWYMSAAEDGHAGAQFNLANMYAKGAGIEQNQAQAARWYLRAAEQGDTASQYNTGNRYALANGTERNPIEAYKWYLIAADQGDEEAANNMKALEPEMTPEQIEEAKAKAAAWKPKIEMPASSSGSPEDF